MRFDRPWKSFWLLLAGGLAIAIPVFVLGQPEPDLAVAPPAAGHPAIELSCGPFVDSFAAMRAEADRIATLAASTAVPLEEKEPAPAGAVEIWKEVAASAQSLDAWAWEAQSQKAPLTLQEATAVASATPLTSQIRIDSAALAGDLMAPAREVDTASLTARMERVARTATTVARALEPLAICDPQQLEVTYAPASSDCEGLDSKFGVKGPCGP